jgi:hypothetical protein
VQPSELIDRELGVIQTGRCWRVRILVGVLSVVGLFAFVSSAGAASITNGGFETGDFTGWTVVNQAGGSGNWAVYMGTTAPNGATIAAPPEGTHAATSYQSGPGSHVLYQDVTLEPNAKHTLTFTLYYTTLAAFATPSTLDYTTIPNQQYRVDVIKPSAPVTSVAAVDVLANLFQTKTGDPSTLAPTVMSFDLSQFAGQTVRLRFAEVDNSGNFYGSVDAVRVTSSPSVVTGAASGVSSTAATVNGTVNPNGQATSYHFDYGTSTAYGSSGATQSAGSGTTTSPVSANLTGLLPGATYHFRLVGQSAGGTFQGTDNTFTTPASPTVATGAASGVSRTSATVNGTVNPNGQATSYHFDYGTSTAYGSSSATQSAGSGTTTSPVSANLTGLRPGTTYHFRLVGQSAGGTSQGTDNTFTTKAVARKPARLHLQRVTARPAGRDCESELNSASTTAATAPRCDHGLVNFTGSIDPRANNQIITILLKARIAGHTLMVRGRGRISHGHLRVTVRLAGRQTDFLTGGRGTGGDRWNYSITYAGSSSLLPARITGHLTLEIER